MKLGKYKTGSSFVNVQFCYETIKYEKMSLKFARMNEKIKHRKS